MTLPDLPDPPSFCWPVDPGCLGDGWGDIPEAVRARAIALATGSLYRLTLGRVGGCPVTVRPCPRSSLPVYPWWQRSLAGPVLWDGSWVNCGCSWANCGCVTGCSVELPTFAGRVDEVKVGADVLDTTDYALIDNQSIAWRGTAACPFPRSQDLSKPPGAEGTFSVTYLPAHEVDGTAAWAAGVLAVEFANACMGENCKLPPNVTAVVRQGISMTVVSGTFPNGLTGIREVDAFIAMWNPAGAKVGVRVYSPDLPRASYE